MPNVHCITLLLKLDFCYRLGKINMNSPVVDQHIVHFEVSTFTVFNLKNRQQKGKKVALYRSQIVGNIVFSVKRWNRKFTQLSVIIRTKVRIMISRFCFASNATLILRKLVPGGRVTCLPELPSQLLIHFLIKLDEPFRRETKRWLG